MADSSVDVVEAIRAIFDHVDNVVTDQIANDPASHEEVLDQILVTTIARVPPRKLIRSKSVPFIWDD